MINLPHRAPLKEMERRRKPHHATKMGKRVALNHRVGSTTPPKEETDKINQIYRKIQKTSNNQNHKEWKYSQAIH